jgi:hypothetical protein
MTVAAAQQLHPRSRARTTNKPFAGLDLRTAAGRRVRDLAVALLQRSGKPINDSLVVADAIAAAELRIAFERTRRDPKAKPEQVAALAHAADEACKPFTPVELRLT